MTETFRGADKPYQPNVVTNTTKPHSNDEVIEQLFGKPCDEYEPGCATCEVYRILAQKDAEMLQRVGMLRQWLNEDRITDTKRMVTNAELLVWLTPPDQTANPTN